MAGRRREAYARAPEQDVGRDTKVLVERPHHARGQAAPAVQDLVDPRPPSKAVRHVGGPETGLVHAEPDRLDRIGRVDRNGLALVGFDDQGEKLDLVLLVIGRIFEIHQ